MRSFSGLSLLLLVSLAACSANSSQPSVPGASSEAVSQREKAPHAERHRRMGGPAVFDPEKLIARAEGTGVNDTQREKLGALRKDLTLRKQALSDARKALTEELASEVEKGTFDDAVLEAKAKAVADAATSEEQGFRDAIVAIHDVLTREQREKFVAFDRPRHEREKHGEGHHGKGPHERREDKGKEHLEKLANELGLTADQKEKIRSALRAERAPEKARHDMGNHKRPDFKAMRENFLSDKMDISALPPPHLGAMARKMAEHRIAFVRTVTKELTAEQRAKFATEVRSHHAR